MSNMNSRLRRWLKGFMLKHMHGMITCKEFEDFVSDYTDGELSSKQRSYFERHLKLCQECRQYLLAYQRTIEVSRAVLLSPDEPVSEDVPEDLIKGILKARKI